ncbi:MAG: phosphoribosyltransferase family protein [Pseudomonadales bacterium]|nr:phosphoribosyltransferase family protein [Pseudomonadales bacterium]
MSIAGASSAVSVRPLSHRRTLGDAALAAGPGGEVIERVFLTAQGLLEDAFRLAHRIHLSGFRPSHIVALWRGGVPIGLAVQEYLEFRGCPSDHIAIRTASYTGIDRQSREVAVYGLSYLIKNLEAEHRLLLVDDVFDTGRTALAVIEELRARLRANMPGDVRIAVPYYKPARREVDLEPDYWLHETEAWLKYPHSLEGLSPAEIREHRPRIWEILGPHLPET